MTRIKCLTDALPADGQREPSTHNIVACRVCGHTFVYRGRQGELNGNFCSMPCQLWYEAGNAPVAAEIFHRRCNGKPMPRTTNGFKIVCAHCGKDFESKGLRCCSGECERAFREREENLVLMAEANIEPKAKRRCECCAAVIPTWRNGRRVSKSVRFCSDKCRKRLGRAAA